jgi:hypothetical protein
MALMYNHSNRSRSIYLDSFKLESSSSADVQDVTHFVRCLGHDSALTSTKWRRFSRHVFTFPRIFLFLTASGVTSIYNRYIKARAYSTATLCQNCKAIGEQLSEIYAFEHDLRFCTNGHLHFYLYRFHNMYTPHECVEMRGLNF